MLIFKDLKGDYWTRRLVANCLGVCKQTVINYENKGILVPDKKLHDGTRLYEPEKIVAFKKKFKKHRRVTDTSKK